MCRAINLLLNAAILAVCTVASTAAFGQWTDPQPLNSYAMDDSGTDQWYPDVATDGAGNWVSIWQDSSGLFATHSVDFGASWISPVTVDAAAAPVKMLQKNYPEPSAAIVYAGNGTWVTLSVSRDDETTRTTAFVSRSTDNGHTWSAPRSVYAGELEPDFDLDTDDNGTLIATFFSRILRSTDFGQSWEVSQPELPSTGTIMNTRIAYAGDNKWLRAVCTYTGEATGSREMYVHASISADNGASWGAATEIVQRTTVQTYPNLGDVGAVGPEMVIALNTFKDHISRLGELEIFASIDRGQTWFEGNTPPDQQQLTLSTPLSVASTGSGKWIVVGERLEGGGGPGYNPLHDIMYSSTDSLLGSWRYLDKVTRNSEAFETRGSMASDGNGNLVVVYQTDAYFGSARRSKDYDIQAVSSLNGGVFWSDAAYADITAPFQLPRLDDRGVEIATGDDSTMVAVWVAAAASGDTDSRIYHSRSTDSGATWSSAILLSSGHPNRGDYTFNPQVFYNGSGRWLITWSVPGDTHFAHSFNNGITWSQPARLNATAVGSNGRGTLILSRFVSAGTIEIYRSADAGLTWSAPFVIPDVPNTIVHSSGTSWFLKTYNNKTYTSHDDGLTWLKESSANSFSEYASFESSHQGTVLAVGISNIETRQYPLLVTQRSLDNGVTWGPVVEVADGLLSFDVAFVNSETVIVVWNEANEDHNPWEFPTRRLIKMSTSYDAGETWTLPVAITESGDNIADPAVGVANGKVVVAWDGFLNVLNTDIFGPDSDIIYITRSLRQQAAARDWQLYE